MHGRRLLVLATALSAVAGLAVVVVFVRSPAPSRPQARAQGRDASGRCRGIALAPGADVQRAIAIHRVGTVFCLAAGAYRVARPIEPKDGMQLIGEGPGRTVLDGSAELTGFVRDAGVWWASGRLP